MRRRRINFKKRKTKTILIVLFVFIFISMGAGYALMSIQFQIFGKINVPKPSGIGTVEFEFTNSWGNYTYRYLGTIKNTGVSNIDGWIVTLDVPQDATATCNVGDTSVSNGVLIIKNKDYNRIIQPGDSITQIELIINTSQSDYEFSYLTFNGIYMNLEGGEDVEPTDMTLNQTNVEIYEGEQINLLPVFTPSNAVGEVTWTSNNTQVATVSASGVVIGVTPGIATITAMCGDLTAECIVTVKSTQATTEDLEIKFTSSNNYQQDNLYVTQYNVSIKNISDTSIIGWSFDLILPAGSSIIGSWGGNVTKVVGSTYRITNLEWNGNLIPGGSANDVGMQIAVPYMGYIPIATNMLVER